MQLTITKQTEETVEIEIPSFYKKGNNDYFAIFGEEDIRNVFRVDKYLLVKKVAIDCFDDEKVLAPENSITEDEFMSVYNAAIESLDLKPRLVIIDDVDEAINGNGGKEREFTEQL